MDKYFEPGYKPIDGEIVMKYRSSFLSNTDSTLKVNIGNKGENIMNSFFSLFLLSEICKNKSCKQFNKTINN